VFYKFHCSLTVCAKKQICMFSLHEAHPISSMERGEREVSTYHLDEPDELMAAAEEWAEGAQEGDYIAIQAFLGCRPEVQDELGRSEEHTSELQSRENNVYYLLLEKQKKKSE